MLMPITGEHVAMRLLWLCMNFTLCSVHRP
jgi:hypothetical protein